MDNTKKFKFGTKAIHGGVEPDTATGAIMTPIYQSSTFAQTNLGEHKGFEYSRSSNPTRKVFEKNIALLENGNHGLAFGSGVAAIDAVLRLFKPGDEIITTNDLYGGTHRLFVQIWRDYGLKFHFTSLESLDDLKHLVNNKTKMIWVETPTNPMMSIVDIEKIAHFSEKYNLMLCVDNTFASPFLQNPLDLGADIVMHSVTKYIGGHSDVLMGALVVNDDIIADQLYFIQKSTGGVPGPQDCFLALRGLKTIHLRMERHCENAKIVAEYLKNHSRVNKVFWPGFKDHPSYKIVIKQMRGFGGMISFSLNEDTIESAHQFLNRLEVFTLAESLGGVESLAGHPATMTHASIPKNQRDKVGISDSLIRLSVGVEDIQDIINDLDQALRK